MRGKIAAVLFWLVLWQGAALALHNPILLAGPAETAQALANLAGQEAFYLALGTSLLRIGGGFFLGAAAAAALALAAWRWEAVRVLLEPLLSALTTVPIAAFVILLLIWTSSRYLSAAISFLVVLPPLYLALLSGLRSTDARLTEMADLFRVPLGRRLWYIHRPALAPQFLSACRLALGLCWKSGVAAEVIGVPAHTIGEGFYMAKISLDTPSLLAWTAALAVLSWLFQRLVLAVLRRLLLSGRETKNPGFSED